MFEVLPAQSNPIEAMLASDVVGSYNSMSLIEALGLGIPAISLCGGTIPADLPAPSTCRHASCRMSEVRKNSATFWTSGPPTEASCPDGAVRLARMGNISLLRALQPMRQR